MAKFHATFPRSEPWRRQQNDSEVPEIEIYARARFQNMQKQPEDLRDINIYATLSR